MTQFKKILHPTDFSDYSKEALDVAAVMARKFGAELIILHVVETYDYAPPEYYMAADELHKEVERRLEGSRKHLEEMAAQMGDIKTRTLVTEGKPFVQIIRAAKEEGADMIVLGTHGRSGLAHILIGSTAEKVVRKAPCPVLTIRSARHEYEHI